MVDYTPLQMELLWVHWYEPMNKLSVWETSTLDRVRFLPMADEYSFNFLDPVDVLRGCHIIMSFTKGKRHPEELGSAAHFVPADNVADDEDFQEYNSKSEEEDNGTSRVEVIKVIKE
ncbi:hypothetical protein BDR06DRAFT_973936 [Suillus hirtellus]|nr:hypothetical protein BDR06DRAFT_973936 [Suillus hirtellus]